MYSRSRTVLDRPSGHCDRPIVIPFEQDWGDVGFGKDVIPWADSADRRKMQEEQLTQILWLEVWFNDPDGLIPSENVHHL